MTSIARPRPPHEDVGARLGQDNKIASWHHERLAAVYVRQSTTQQVLLHAESTRLQYGLVSRAEAYGWASDRIVVIDEDLGKSGATAAGRVGFERLVTEVSLGHVGLILGLEMSRLARSNVDWHRLLEVCALFGTLIADLDGLYDPALYNDRLLLGLKGTMSEAELHLLKQRLYQGCLSKARRGALTFALPSGYVWDADGRIQFDPDEQVQAVVRLLFAQFAELGTLGGLLHYLARHEIRLGLRVREGPGKGQLVWRRPNRATLQNLLKHPLYAGAYVYGRRQMDRRRYRPEHPKSGRVVMARSAWHSLLPDRCPAYISWEQYEHNMARLAANQARASTQGVVRNGAALLAGLVVCARCGVRLGVHYQQSHGRPTAVPRPSPTTVPTDASTTAKRSASMCPDRVWMPLSRSTSSRRSSLRRSSYPSPRPSRSNKTVPPWRSYGSSAGNALPTRRSVRPDSTSRSNRRTAWSLGRWNEPGRRSCKRSRRWRKSIIASCSNSHGSSRVRNMQRFASSPPTFRRCGTQPRRRMRTAKRSSARWLSRCRWKRRARANRCGSGSPGRGAARRKACWYGPLPATPTAVIMPASVPASTT
jgi:DNA invertase Pin-like site-specific DNA recombinase